MHPAIPAETSATESSLTKRKDRLCHSYQRTENGEFFLGLDETERVHRHEDVSHRIATEYSMQLEPDDRSKCGFYLFLVIIISDKIWLASLFFTI
jgi:hypothetical protein